MEKEEEIGKITMNISKSLIYDFRKAVKKRGYTQKFVITRIMEEVIKELNQEHDENSGVLNEKQQSL